MAIEAVVENYGEYMDYNSITTQSDRGEMLYTLLDFLRLRASYDRVAWQLRPMMLVHQVLVRCGRDGAAEIWRQAIAQRTAPVGRRASAALRAAVQEVRDASAEHRRTPGRAVRPAAGDRPALCA